MQHLKLAAGGPNKPFVSCDPAYKVAKLYVNMANYSVGQLVHIYSIPEKGTI
jgi:hypothetical protein